MNGGRAVESVELGGVTRVPWVAALAAASTVIGFFALSLRSSPVLGCCCIRWDWEVPACVAIFFGLAALLSAGLATLRSCFRFVRRCIARRIWRRCCAGPTRAIPDGAGPRIRALSGHVRSLRLDLSRELWLGPALAASVLEFAARNDHMIASFGLHPMCCAAISGDRRALRQALALDHVLARFDENLRQRRPPLRL